jgi:Skp family chaperone for outer membrane proteins
MKTKMTSRFSLIGFGMIAALASAGAMAQSTPTNSTTDIPGHPRVSEVNQRLDNQQNRIQQGVADGQMNAAQAARDEKQDSNIAQRESRDEAEHDGHLTKQEQKNLNKSLNQDSKRIHKQRTDGK